MGKLASKTNSELYNIATGESGYSEADRREAIDELTLRGDKHHLSVISRLTIYNNVSPEIQRRARERLKEIEG